MITVRVKATKDSNRIVLDRNVIFEPGVRYVIQADFDLYLTWKNRDNHYDRRFDSVKSIELANFTSSEHHERFNDNLIYFVNFARIDNYANIPVSIVSHLRNQNRLTDLWDEKLEDTIYNSPIESTEFTDRDFESVFQKLTDEDFERKLVQVQKGFDSPQLWVNGSNYLSVSSNGDRIGSSRYRLVREKTQSMVYLEETKTNVIVKTDLYHYATSNGSNEIEFIIQPGEDRAFYLNDLNRDCEDFEIHPTQSLQNRVNVRGSFSDYMLTRFPNLYQFVKLVIDYQNLNDSPQSYLSNLIDDSNVERMSSNLVEKEIAQSFGVSEYRMDGRNILRSQPDFVRSKGTKSSIEWVAKSFFGIDDLRVENLEKNLLRLSGSDWFERTSIFFPASILENLDLGSLDGKSMVGTSSKTVGVVESVFKSFVSSGEPIYEFVVREGKPGFTEDDMYVVDGKLINCDCVNKGVVGIDIESGGFGYRVNDRIVTESTTGSQFKGRVLEVDSNGSIQSIQIDSPGWNFRDFQKLRISIEGDNRQYQPKILDVRLKGTDELFTVTFRNRFYTIQIKELERTISAFGSTYLSSILESYVNFVGFIQIEGVICVITSNSDIIQVIAPGDILFEKLVGFDFFASTFEDRMFVLNKDTNRVQVIDIPSSVRDEQFNVLFEFEVPINNTYTSISCTESFVFLSTETDIFIFTHGGKRTEFLTNRFSFLTDEEGDAIIDDEEFPYFVQESIQVDLLESFVYEDDVFENDVFETNRDAGNYIRVSSVIQNGVELFIFDGLQRQIPVQFLRKELIQPTATIQTGRILRRAGSYQDIAGHSSSIQKTIGSKFQPFSISLNSKGMDQPVAETIRDSAIPPGFKIENIREDSIHFESFLLDIE